MHVDPELLALLALGEDEASDSVQTHLQHCSICAGELADLGRLTSLSRSLDSGWTILSPDDHVWVDICTELGLDPAGADPQPPSRSGGSVSVLTARAHLTAVDAAWSNASGSAELVIDERGRRVLQVDLEALLPQSGLRQAWLIHRNDPSRRQTLGVLDDRHGLWTVAQSIDLDDYAILDISQQSLGDTDHSGQTIVRGELTQIAA